MCWGGKSLIVFFLLFMVGIYFVFIYKGGLSVYKVGINRFMKICIVGFRKIFA